MRAGAMNAKQKILVVDDEQFSLDILQFYLTQKGYEVVQAVDGLAALKKLEENPDVDLILIDRMLPKLGGLECVRKIRGDDRFRRLPIIVQSALALPEQIDEGVEAGANHYLAKPYDRSTLLSAVEQVLRQSRPQVAAEAL
jgi:CheY-like chemotaxis protein